VARYTSLDALLADLDRWLNREPLRADAASLRSRLRALWRGSRRTQALVTLALLGAVAAGAGLALSLLR